MISGMGQSPQDVLKKHNRPNARQRRHRRAARSPVEDMAFCASRRVTICAASLQERLGLTTKDADFSAVWLTRDQFGMTFLDQLGLMDIGDFLELSKGLSKIGAKIFRVCGLNFGHQSPPFLSSINTHLVPRCCAPARNSFAQIFTYIRCYLFPPGPQTGQC